MLARYLPILEWGRTYNRSILTNDLVAAVIVTIMLIPQSLAYALLAGLPPIVGLYASILPLIAYALFGTSRTLAVGPVAVLSLMTASAAGAVAMPFVPFALGSLIGRGARFFIVAGLVRWFGPVFEQRLLKYIDWIGWAIVAAVFIAVAVYQLR